VGLDWLSRDARLVIAARALRTFGYGCTSVLIAGMLTADGASPARVGLLLAVAAAGSVLASILMGLFADRFGRRSSLLVTSGLMGGAGLVFAFSESFPLLLVAAFVGTISPSTNDNTPFSGVEQAILAQTYPPQRHTARSPATACSRWR
jgi:MFS family permease